MKSFVINDSANGGYIAEIKNDTLEIYVPDNIDGYYITVEDLKEKIPKKYISGITKVIIGNRMRELMEKNKQYWKDKCPFDYEFID